MGSIQQDPSARIGQVLRDKYTIESLLGSGGIGTVYAARHRQGRRVAIKMLHPEMSARPDVCERFRKEMYAANRVIHEGAVQIFDDDVAEDGSAYLVMELLEGESLAARANRQAIDTNELLGWVDEILDALAAYHTEGIVHRDIKPDNIFLTSDGRVKILDFGIARVNDIVPGNFKTQMGTALGTAPYMAPEQALGKVDEVDGRADLFSVGATMFRLIARRRIHEAKSEADLLVAMATLPAPPLAWVVKDAPVPVCTIVDRALAFLVARRYPDAPTMQLDVRAVRRGGDPPFATGLLAKGMVPWVQGEPSKTASGRPVSDRAPRRVEPTAVDTPLVSPQPTFPISDRPRPAQVPPRPGVTPRPPKVSAAPMTPPEVVPIPVVAVAATPQALTGVPPTEPVVTPAPLATPFPPMGVGSPSSAGGNAPLPQPGPGFPAAFLAPPSSGAPKAPAQTVVLPEYSRHSAKPAILALIAAGAALVLGLLATLIWWATGTLGVGSAPTTPALTSSAPVAAPASAATAPPAAGTPTKAPAPMAPPAAAPPQSAARPPAAAPKKKTKRSKP